MAVKVEVWGPYACFTRPEAKVERVSYDVMTPSAARGILDAILWHPGMVWKIDKIHVCAPIRFTNIRRNEVSDKVSAVKAKSAMQMGNPDDLSLYVQGKVVQQRASMILRDVHYVIEAHFEMTDKAAPADNPGKYQEMMRRRLEKGQFYHQPYFGTREFPVSFAPCEKIPECPEELKGTIDLSWMLYDMDFSDPADIKPVFFRASMQDGVITVPNFEEGKGFVR